MWSRNCYFSASVLSLALSACSAGTVQDDSDEVLSVSQAVVEPPLRYIPIRAIVLVDDTCATSRKCDATNSERTCSGSGGLSDSQYDTLLAASINYTNNRYKDFAHVWFYLKSFTRVQAKYTWCNSGSPTWGQVRGEIRSAFPEIPSTGWPLGTSMTATEWLSTAAALSFDDAINVYIGNGSTNMCSNGDSCGRFPCRGKYLYVSNSSLSQQGNVFPHELGHYLSLAHTWDWPACKSPVTKAPYPKAANWGFVFSEDQFFQSQEEAAPYESTLQRIKNTEQNNGNCVKNAANYIECTLNGHVYNGGGPASGNPTSVGDPEIAALGRYNPSLSRYETNLMSYGGNYLAASQSGYIQDALDYETPYGGFEHLNNWPVWALAPKGRRPQLGLAREMLDESASFCFGSADKMFVGDFNADGKSDLLCNGGDSTLRIRFMNSSLADLVVPNRNWCTHSNERLYVGDFDGVQGDDLLCLNSAGDQFIDLNDGQGNFGGSNFINYARKLCPFHLGNLYIGQFDGVGGDDTLCNWFNDGTMTLDYSNAQGQLNGNDWQSTNRNFCLESGSRLYVADVNNDGRDDIMCNRANGDLIIDLHSGGFTGSDSWTGRNFCTQASAQLLVGDYNGDGLDDIACVGGTYGVEIDWSQPNTYFWNTNWFGKLDGFCQSGGIPLSGDFDGDGKADLLCNGNNGVITTVYSGM